ncbi:MAG: electron transfer flavoprotein subunit alpha/FixB family protein, partial [Desulfosarcinaceae bacterium]
MTSRDIWIYGDLRSMRHWRNSLMVMTKARKLAQTAGAGLVMVLLAGSEKATDQDPADEKAACLTLTAAAGQALEHGAGKVRCLTHPLLAVPRSDLHAAALSGEVKNQSPWLVLFSLNDFGREAAAFCTQACQAGMIADAAELDLVDGQIVGRCPAWGGRIMADITLAPGWATAFVTVQPHGVKLQPDGNPQGPVETQALDDVTPRAGLVLKKRSLQPAESRRLEEADIVVAGGAGLGDIQGFGLVRELAAALGGEVGATRPPVLNHWVAEDRLIGQTGKTIHPNLLITVGTSGAVQFTAGISEARTIVAINRDPKAPIFQWADLGLVADAAAVLPLLAQRAKQGALRRLTDAACSLQENKNEPPGGFGGLVARLRQARDWSREKLAQATGQT